MMKKNTSNYSYNDCVTVPLIGNLRKDIGSHQYNAHSIIEKEMRFFLNERKIYGYEVYS